MFFNSLQMSLRCLRCTNVLPSQKITTMINPQRYGSWLHRRPSAVINEEIVLNDVEPAPKPRKYVDEDVEHRPLRVKPRKRPVKVNHPKPAVVRSAETFKDDGTLNYATILDDNRELSTLMLNVKSKKLREKNQQFLLEGHRLIADAIKAGLNPQIILFSRPSDVSKIPLPARDVKLLKVPYKMLQLWSGLTTTPGVMGIFQLPESFEKEPMGDSVPVTIICDNVREPGNLGAILRAAAGAGCERVILMKGCVDLWDSKVLRSAAGAHFRVSLFNSVEWENVDSMISPTAKIFAADNNVTLSSKVETKAPVVEAEDFDDESDENDNDDAEPMGSSDESESMEKPEEKSAECHEGSQETVGQVSSKELINGLPVIPYYAVDYTTNEIVLVVGGEAHGLSPECIELVRERGGVRINVPLTNDVESLNTGMALGILAFEIRKQFLIRRDNMVKQSTVTR